MLVHALDRSVWAERLGAKLGWFYGRFCSYSLHCQFVDPPQKAVYLARVPINHAFLEAVHDDEHDGRSDDHPTDQEHELMDKHQGQLEVPIHASASIPDAPWS